jgi:uncharacterized protein (DUF433 family)
VATKSVAGPGGRTASWWHVRIAIAPEPVPLRWDEHGRLMIVGHRIAFEIIVDHYRRSRSAEAVHRSYPALPLADIHVLLA